MILFFDALLKLNFVIFRWYINDKKVIGDYTTEMIIHNVTRELHDAIVKCEVHNDVGKSEETETLDVTCTLKNIEIFLFKILFIYNIF